MSCTRCRQFFGIPPCPICKTVLRIGDLSKHLDVHHERQALGALRDCAGTLSDLVEDQGFRDVAAARRGLPSGSVPGPAIPEVPRGSNPEKPAEPNTPKEEADKPEETVEEKKPKEKKKKARAKEKDTKKDKPKKSKEPPEEANEAEEPKGSEEAAPAVPEESALPAASSSKSDRRGPREVPTREDVEARPEDHGLAKIEVRGSLQRHFNEGVTIRTRPGSERPPEPDHSPPRRDRDRHHDGREGRPERSRSGDRQGRWRGYKHFLRGREHWQSIKKKKR